MIYRTLAESTAPAYDPYLQYGALGLLLFVLVAIFWKGVPQIGTLIERNVKSVCDAISTGFSAVGSQIGEMRRDLSGIETRHATHIDEVKSRLDRIDTGISEVKAMVSREKREG